MKIRVIPVLGGGRERVIRRAVVARGMRGDPSRREMEGVGRLVVVVPAMGRELPLRSAGRDARPGRSSMGVLPLAVGAGSRVLWVVAPAPTA